MYQQVILDHSKFPHGRGLPEGEGAATVVAVAPHPGCGISHQVNPTCGDEITLRVDVTRTGGVPVIADVRWEGQGCSISQASASVLCDLVVGQDLATVDRLSATFHDLMSSRGAGLHDEAAEESLGDAIAFTGVSKFAARVKCALLGWAALSDALILSGAREDV
jgi:nitrogen fixation NifU-like protein